MERTKDHLADMLKGSSILPRPTRQMLGLLGEAPVEVRGEDKYFPQERRHKLLTRDVRTSNTHGWEKERKMIVNRLWGNCFPQRHMLANVGETAYQGAHQPGTQACTGEI